MDALGGIGLPGVTGLDVFHWGILIDGIMYQVDGMNKGEHIRVKITKDIEEEDTFISFNKIKSNNFKSS